ncbi:hypothetical protein C8R43DRAFT_1117560 [Mycena crocata]|nr:hypothetical protein C8R43DRAFT_1117560 [Mycena crocata]
MAAPTAEASRTTFRRQAALAPLRRVGVNAFGVSLDTPLKHQSHTYTKTDWEIWMTGIETTTAMRLYWGGHEVVSDGQNKGPFGDLYDTVSGAVNRSTVFCEPQRDVPFGEPQWDTDVTDS